MRSILDGVLFLLALLLGAAGAVHADGKPVVYWPYFNYPPYFIAAPGMQPQGMGIDVAREVQKELPEYRHVFILASPERIFEELRSGRERFVVCGVNKTPERGAYALYSGLPCRVTFSMMIIMRREDYLRLAPDGSASLAYLVADHTLTFGYIPGINYASFARYVDPLISNAGLRRTVTAHDVGQLLNMLAEKRIDWFVHDGLGVGYMIAEQGIEDRVAVVNAVECPPNPIFGYLACSRAGKGPGIMECVNRAMIRLAISRRLYEAFKRWIPERLDPAFEQAYTQSILPAAHLAAYGEARCLPETERR
ncbi:Bacterial extracellular solute-binding protein, family 3 [Pseudodesulfovibrio hydrargyri]|uniref:Bacterial extracellular solute-binding protein, family 3 n=1 Tax=Pseudodesulfovibrio hydrargyri TaxID=2125990 RepID=A0A1J5NBU9_9BACT|nr:transporter substrate-binding domain-containing protein [Pseudodesulfovibrio hydrargyri]OIQ50695.1 Bacterial extracellular solute-binding protein, family 3 [Pseudodesulfovibrio hydrargyri]